MLMINDLPQTIDEAYLKRANYITYDRSSKVDILEDNELYFKADDSIKDFIRDPYIIDSFVYLLLFLCIDIYKVKKHGCLLTNGHAIWGCTTTAAAAGSRYNRSQ